MPDTVPVGTALLTYVVDNKAAIAAVNANKLALRQLATAQKRVENFTLRANGSAAAIRQINGITSALERQLAVTQQLATAQAAVSRTVSRSVARQSQSAQEQVRNQSTLSRLTERGREALSRFAQSREREGGRFVRAQREEQQQQQQQQQQSRTFASEQQRSLQARQQAEQQLRQQQFAGVEAQQQIQQQQQQQGRASRRDLAERARLAEQQVEQQQRQNQQTERNVETTNRAAQAERRVVQLQQQTSQQRVVRAEQRERQAERNVQTAQQRVQRESQNLQRIANEVTAQQPRNAEAQIRNAERRLEQANRQLDRAEQRAQTTRQQTQTARLSQQTQEARAQRRLASIEENQARQEERRSQRRQQQIDRETRSRTRQRVEVERAHSQALNLLRREEAARERSSRAQVRANHRAVRATQASSRSTTNLIRQLTLASSTFTGLYAFGFEALTDLFVAPFRAINAPVDRARRNIQVLRDLTRETLISGVAGAGRRVEAVYRRAGIAIDGATAKILRNEAAVASASGRIGSLLAGVGTASTGVLGGLGIVGAVVAGGSVAFAAQFEREFTNVIKTVNSATTDIGELEQQLADLSQVTPGSVIGLSQIATIAGQLGIEGAANISRFVDTVARLEVSTDLAREDAAFQLARLANRFQTDQYERLGSIIVALGNSLPTTERRILELTTRFSASGRIAGLTADQILAISAAVSSVGIQSELGGTALQRIFLRLFEAIARGGEELENFASIARLSGEEFRELFRESPRDALQVLLRGIQDEVPDTVADIRQAVEQGGQELQRLASIAQLTSDQFVDAFQIDPDSIFETLLQGAQANTSNALDQFRQLELGGQRLLLTILSLAGQQGLVADAFDTASEAARSQNDLFRESELFYGTFIEQLKQLGSNLRNNAIELGQVFLPTLTAWLVTNNEILRRLQSARVLGIGRIEALRASPAEIRTIGDRLESAPLEVARIRERELRAELIQLSSSYNDLANRAEGSTGRRLAIYTNQLAEIEAGITEAFTEITRVRERINREEESFSGQEPPPPEPIQVDPAELERVQRQLDERRLAIVANIQLRREELRQQFEDIRTEFEDILVFRPQLISDLEESVQAAFRVGREGPHEIVRTAIDDLERVRDELIEVRNSISTTEILPQPSTGDSVQSVGQVYRNLLLERFRSLQGSFREAVESLNINTENLSPAQLLELADILPGLQQQIELNEFAMRRLLNLSGDFIAELVAGGNEGEAVFERLARVANRFLQELLDLIIQTTVLRPLLENLLSSFPSIGQLLGGGRIGNPADAGLNPAQSGGLRRGFTLVGEGGPEIVDFRTASRVYSNSQLANALGSGGSTVINFSPVIQSTDGPGVRAALQQVLPQFEQVVRNNLARDVSRPSAMRQQLRNA